MSSDGGLAPPAAADQGEGELTREIGVRSPAGQPRVLATDNLTGPVRDRRGPAGGAIYCHPPP